MLPARLNSCIATHSTALLRNSSPLPSLSSGAGVEPLLAEVMLVNDVIRSRIGAQDKLNERLISLFHMLKNGFFADYRTHCAPKIGFLARTLVKATELPTVSFVAGLVGSGAPSQVRGPPDAYAIVSLCSADSASEEGPSLNSNGLLSAYQSHTTQTVRRTCTPAWKSTFDFIVSDLDEEVSFSVLARTPFGKAREL